MQNMNPEFYKNIKTQVSIIRQKLGEFDFGKYMDEDQNEYRPMVKYENGKMYEGEWLKGNHIKQGRGCCIYSNGQFYEGWWSQNKRNGFGRTILGDGEFQGDWY